MQDICSAIANKRLGVGPRHYELVELTTQLVALAGYIVASAKKRLSESTKRGFRRGMLADACKALLATIYEIVATSRSGKVDVMGFAHLQFGD
jgi:hypothetical protein